MLLNSINPLSFLYFNKSSKKTEVVKYFDLISKENIFSRVDEIVQLYTFFQPLQCDTKSIFFLLNGFIYLCKIIQSPLLFT